MLRFKKVYKGLIIGTILNIILSFVSARIIESDPDWLVIFEFFSFISIGIFILSFAITLGAECLYETIKGDNKEEKES